VPAAVGVPPLPAAVIDKDTIAHACIAAVKSCEPVSVRHVAYRVPPEPWYYKLIAFVGRVTCILGILSALAGLLMAIAAAHALSGTGQVSDGAGYSIAALMASSIPMFVAAAVQLLGVDVARNIRAIRYHQH
jgi:hypothetical protein